MASTTLDWETRQALALFAADLRRVFGNRLLSICAYGLQHHPDGDTRTIVLVDRLTFDDLAACVPLARKWDGLGLAVPLLLEEHEFIRTLDVFPLEYGDIIAHHVVIAGSDPRRLANAAATPELRAGSMPCHGVETLRRIPCTAYQPPDSLQPESAPFSPC